MGEVYKVRDTRLERFVAVKVLPEHIAMREDLRGRFQREARAVVSRPTGLCIATELGRAGDVIGMVAGGKHSISHRLYS